MRAYLIDPPNAQVVEVDYNGDWRTIGQHIHAELFTTVVLNKARDTIFVDDCGLINDNPHGWFILKTYGQPLRGYGLVLGSNAAGESIEPYASLDHVKALIEFPKYVNEMLIDRNIHVKPL